MVLTGAGVSAESGIPTFRGPDGLWKNHKPEELASPSGFAKDSALVWEWYNWRRDVIRKAKPNLAHYALVDMESRIEEFTLITQNVDNLHFEAGSQNVHELHGNIFNVKCTSCGFKADNYAVSNNAPKCPDCGNLLRPDVVWFGEELNPAVLAKAQEASATCELFFIIGTSALVHPAASFPSIAKANGCFLVEINTEDTPLTPQANEVIRGKASEWLPKITILYDKITGKS